MNVRSARENEIEQLARIWYEGWRDAHERILPEELARDRTLESFKVRLREALANVRVAGPPGEPAGFSILKDDELYQLYVSDRRAEQASRQPWLQTPRLCSPNVAWRKPGSHAPLEMIGPQDSTNGADGVASAI